MRTDLHYYDIYPKVFPAGKEVEICLKPLGAHVDFKKDVEYFITINPLEEGNPEHYTARSNRIFPDCKVGEDGILRFKFLFPTEQQYYVRLYDNKDKLLKDRDKIAQLAVYALNEDLCGRYPFMGDLHMHTFRSDGKQSPAVVCANYRKHGYDFFAITDHQRYYPSLEAIEAFRDVPIEFNIVPGEEIHLPWLGECINDVHIVNFGSNYSVNALVRGTQSEEVGEDASVRSYKGFPCPEVITPEEYKNQVLALAETLTVPEGVERFSYASCVWIFNHIRAGGGLGIFAHPYWISNVFQVPETLTDYLLETHPFDAFEVLGGENYYEQNGLQTQKYYDDLAKGRRYPIVGSTDSHSSVNNNNAYVASTIVFSPENEKDALIASIKDFYSVAVDGISKEFRLVGDFRLSKYACFLLNEYFPLHDDLCYEEGRLMKDYACGIGGAAEGLRFISGRMTKQREKYFKF